jgi:hypothetical protein
MSSPETRVRFRSVQMTGDRLIATRDAHHDEDKDRESITRVSRNRPKQDRERIMANVSEGCNGVPVSLRAATARRVPISFPEDVRHRRLSKSASMPWAKPLHGWVREW